VRDALTVACSRVVTLNINTGLMQANCAALLSPLCACTAIIAEILNFVIDPELSGAGLATKDKHYRGHKE